MPITIFHNPRCSKSRATLALLHEHGHSPEIIEYLKAPLDSSTLHTLANKLGLSLSDIVRTGEQVFKDNDLINADDNVLVAAINEHPILLQRPIVVSGDRAAIGRPPESVLDILSSSAQPTSTA